MEGRWLMEEGCVPVQMDQDFDQSRGGWWVNRGGALFEVAANRGRSLPLSFLASPIPQ